MPNNPQTTKQHFIFEHSFDSPVQQFYFSGSNIVKMVIENPFLISLYKMHSKYSRRRHPSKFFF